jgi:hypothetical protein
MLPSFLIIGSQKAGTTSLYEVLARHPEVSMSSRKEVHFFIHDHLYRRGLRRYEQFFQPLKPGSRAVGEATPGYLCYPEVPARIAAHLPAAKLILTVREPVSRAYSQYWYARRHLTEPLTFEQAADRYFTRSYLPGQPGYFSRGFYADYLRRYFDHFPREQILVLLFEELIDHPEALYSRLFEFIGVDPTFHCPEMAAPSNPSFIWSNPCYRYFYDHPARTTGLPVPARRLLCSGPRRPEQYPPLDPTLRAALVERYRAANEELGHYLGTDLAHWNP